MDATASGTTERARTAAGVAMMCTGVACLCANDAIGKTLTATYPPVQILFLRNALALPVAALVAWRMGGAAALRTASPGAHLLRGLLWLCAATLFFTGLSLMGLAEATVYLFTAPIFITALSALLFRETVGMRRWLAVLAGFAGVLVALRPGSGAVQAAALFPLATAVFYALLMLSARWVDARESMWTMMLYLVAGGAFFSGIASLFVWAPVRAADMGLFAGIALFGTLGMTLMTQAFRLAPAVVVAPLDYTALVWASLLGWAIWSEVPDGWTYLGAAIIAASGIYIVWREQRAEA